MIALDPDALAAVTGGATTDTTLTSPFTSITTKQSDYARCVDTVKQQAEQAYPRPGWFGSDTNADKRARMVLDNLPKVCGLPGK